MCGRYPGSRYTDKLEKRFGVKLLEFDFAGRFNIAPTQQAPVIYKDDGEYVIKAMRWGLIPHWAKDESIGVKCINAMVESLEEKPMWRDAFKKRRCLVPAGGFYEWTKGKQPFRFQLKSGDALCFAGLASTWKSPEGNTVDSFAIITVPAQRPVDLVHERMPKIIDPAEYDAWLSDDCYIAALGFPLAEPLEAFAVSRRLNSSKNEGEDLSIRLLSSVKRKPVMPGDTITVRDAYSIAKIPDAIPQDARVKVIGNQDGKVTVEYEGRQYTVDHICTDSGFFYQIGYDWLDEKDPLIAEAVEIEHTLREERAEAKSTQGALFQVGQPLSNPLA